MCPTPISPFDAHLAGYGFGLLVVLGLLAGKLIDGSYDDLWGSLRQWRRRRRFRDAVSDEAPGDPISVKATDDKTADAVLELRAQIAQATARRDNAEAAHLYRQLLGIDPKQVLPRQVQLDMANQLMADGQWQRRGVSYVVKGVPPKDYANPAKAVFWNKMGRKEDIATDVFKPWDAEDAKKVQEKISKGEMGPKRWHNGVVNIVMADGHVISVKTKEQEQQAKGKANKE